MPNGLESLETIIPIAPAPDGNSLLPYLAHDFPFPSYAQATRTLASENFLYSGAFEIHNNKIIMEGAERQIA